MNINYILFEWVIIIHTKKIIIKAFDISQDAILYDVDF